MDIEPMEYTEYTAFKERKEIITKVNEIIETVNDVNNRLGSTTIISDIPIVKTGLGVQFCYVNRKDVILFDIWPIGAVNPVSFVHKVVNTLSTTSNTTNYIMFTRNKKDDTLCGIECELTFSTPSPNETDKELKITFKVYKLDTNFNRIEEYVNILTMSGIKISGVD